MRIDFEAQCRGRMWGVFRRDGPSEEIPLAMFAFKSDAIAWRKSNSPDDSVLRSDLYISYHNGPPGRDPKPEFEHFMPTREDE